MGGGETERFGDKQRMTKTERGRANKRKPECVCVCAGERARDGERARLCAPPLVDELVSNQIRYRLPPQLSVKTQSPRRHLSPRHTQPLRSPLLPSSCPPQSNSMNVTLDSTTHTFSLRGHILSGSKRITYRIKFYTVFP